MTKVKIFETNNKDERMKMVREMVIRENNTERCIEIKYRRILQIKITGGKNILQLILLNFCKSNFEHKE